MSDRVQQVVDDILKGAPRWFTAEIVQETIALFDPRYGRERTAEEVREIIIRLGRFVDVAMPMSMQMPFLSERTAWPGPAANEKTPQLVTSHGVSNCPRKDSNLEPTD